MSVREVGRRVAAWGSPFEFNSLSWSDGDCLVASRGGETRWYVRSIEGGYAVTSSQRSDDAEFFEMLAVSLDDVERFLVGMIGPAVRSELLPSAPRIEPLVRREDLLAPFTYVSAPDDSGRGDLLESGRFRARFSSFASVYTAVRFSQYANVPVETLKAAFLDPAGAPLFAVNPLQLSV